MSGSLLSRCLALQNHAGTLYVRFADVDQWLYQRAVVKALAAERLEACRDAEGRMGFEQGVRYTLARR